jgi:4-amino-4-deoxy-L-arabinose transferase-like glycosyltransferase
MNKKVYPLILFFSSAFFFLPFLGKMHLFDWDEINFAESAREMIVSGNYSRVQIDFKPFWEKPPLFFWMQTLCMHIFGVTEFAARLPNAIMGFISLLSSPCWRILFCFIFLRGFLLTIVVLLIVKD